ncbi:MAG: DUF3622 domain-containing protein [Gammaproteobacteria bacterium]|nr:DUF3622 domain-containing protein [Gammaproteobacteria bacterium]
MATSKKFSWAVIETEDGWGAEIKRRVTARKSRVSKRQTGFASRVEARAWAEKELTEFFKTLGESNKKKRRVKNG